MGVVIEAFTAYYINSGNSRDILGLKTADFFVRHCFSRMLQPHIVGAFAYYESCTYAFYKSTMICEGQVTIQLMVIFQVYLAAPPGLVDTL